MLSVKELKGLVKVYYDTEDKKKRKEMSQYIYLYAKKLIPYLEANKKEKLESIK